MFVSWMSPCNYVMCWMVCINIIMDGLQTTKYFPVPRCVKNIPTRSVSKLDVGEVYLLLRTRQGNLTWEVFIGTHSMRLSLYSFYQYNPTRDKRRIRGWDTVALPGTHVFIVECINPILNILRFSITANAYWYAIKKNVTVTHSKLYVK